MKIQTQVMILSVITLMLLSSSVIFSTPRHNVEAKKKTTEIKYSVQIRFINACSCTLGVTISLKDDDKQTIATRQVDLGHLADYNDDSDFYGPKIPVRDHKDQHPNEVTACMKNSHVNVCKHLQGSRKSFYVIFDARQAGRKY